MLQEDLRDFAPHFRAYTELRVQESRSAQVVLVNGSNSVNRRWLRGGVSARVYQQGAWGFASHSQLDRAIIPSVIAAASDNAAFLGAREGRREQELPHGPAVTREDRWGAPLAPGQEELLAFARGVDDHLARRYPALASRTVMLQGLDREKTVFTSEGSHSYSLLPRSFVYVRLTMEQDGRPVELMQPYGGLGSLGENFASPEALHGGLETQYQHLVEKSQGVYAEAGLHTCVLDAEVAGILAHEAIGHTTEADLVMGGSVAGHLLNQEAASPLITLADYAHTMGGRLCPEPVYVDDEGTLAQDVVIIEEGVLKSFMHNKESARHFGAAPTGNARAFAFSDEPLIRMRNTAIVPGTSRLEDMIASVDRGYYLVKHGSGQADSTSEFMFGVTLGYEIQSGQLGRAIRDTTISGVAFQVLKTVSMVSNDMQWMASGMCGKKQGIPVGAGGPAIKCVVSIGGR